MDLGPSGCALARMNKISGSTRLKETSFVASRYCHSVLKRAFSVTGSNAITRLFALGSRTISIVESLFQRFGVPESAVWRDRFLNVARSVMRTIWLPKLGSTAIELA